jgi:hypothetical protein
MAYIQLQGRRKDGIAHIVLSEYVSKIPITSERQWRTYLDRARLANQYVGAGKRSVFQALLRYVHKAVYHLPKLNS